MRKESYFLLDRSLFHHWVWKRGAKEWIRLIGLAAFKDTETRFSGYPISVKTGQYATTYRWLANDWGQQLSWVSRFLHRLEAEGMITLEPIILPRADGPKKGRQDGTLITVVNYCSYQHKDDPATASGNANPNAVRDIEERSRKKELEEAAAAGVHNRGRRTPSSRARRSAATEVPTELQELLEELTDETGGEVGLRGNTVEEALELAERIGWPRLRSEALKVARAAAKRDDAPYSFRYYTRAVRENVEDAEERADNRRRLGCIVGEVADALGAPKLRREPPL